MSIVLTFQQKLYLLDRSGIADRRDVDCWLLACDLEEEFISDLSTATDNGTAPLSSEAAEQFLEKQYVRREQQFTFL